MGRRRLAFDELLDLQLMLIRARAVAKRSGAVWHLPCAATDHEAAGEPARGS